VGDCVRSKQGGITVSACVRSQQDCINLGDCVRSKQGGITVDDCIRSVSNIEVQKLETLHYCFQLYFFEIFLVILTYYRTGTVTRVNLYYHTC
jgi:hypothetical protein